MPRAAACALLALPLVERLARRGHVGHRDGRDGETRPARPGLRCAACALLRTCKHTLLARRDQRGGPPLASRPRRTTPVNYGAALVSRPLPACCQRGAARRGLLAVAHGPPGHAVICCCDNKFGWMPAGRAGLRRSTALSHTLTPPPGPDRPNPPPPPGRAPEIKPATPVTGVTGHQGHRRPHRGAGRRGLRCPSESLGATMAPRLGQLLTAADVPARLLVPGRHEHGQQRQQARAQLPATAAHPLSMAALRQRPRTAG